VLASGGEEGAVGGIICGDGLTTAMMLVMIKMRVGREDTHSAKEKEG
jgi:hypothetical protein